MKKLTVIFMMLFYVGLRMSAQEATAYAVWSASNTTLYFTNRTETIIEGSSFTPEGTTETLTATNVWSGTAVTASAYTPAWYNTVRNNIMTVVFEPSFSDARPTSMRAWFYSFTKLTDIQGLNNLNTSEVTNMYQTFYHCSALTSLDLSTFNTSKVTTMYDMLDGCTGLTTVNLSAWNTSAVNTMEYMFYGCTGLTDINLSGWNTSAVTNMHQMFYGCSKLTNLDLSGFNTSQLTNVSAMFQNCSALESVNLSGWTNEKLTNLSNMFYNCQKLSSVNLTGFCTPAATSISAMFYGCSSLPTVNLASFNTSKVTNMSNLFYGCNSLQSIELTPLNTAAVTNLSYMFHNCESLTSLNLSSLNTAACTNMSYMFNGCKALTAINLSSLNTAKVQNMSYMFQNCSELTTIDFTSFDTSACTNMGYMFNGCSKLGSLDLSPFNTAKVTNMSYMFQNCSQLISIFVSDAWTTAAAGSSANMFKSCDMLVGQDGTTLASYNPVSVDRTHATDEAGGYMKTGTSQLLDEPMAYAVWCADNTTLYFLKTQRQLVAGRSFTPEGSSTPIRMTSVWNGTQVTATGSSNPGWYNSIRSTLTDVVFEPSFADATPSSLRNWFKDCIHLSSLSGISNLNGSAVTNMGWMFSGCTSIQNVNLSGLNLPLLTTVDYMFNGATSLQSVNLSDVNTPLLNNLGYMFNGCTQLASVNLSGFDTPSVTSMSYMFQNCQALQTVDLSSFNTEKLTNMSYMFNGCSSLTQLNLSNFNTSRVSSIAYVFQNCSNLTSVYVSLGWTLNASTYDGNNRDMFTGCTHIVGEDGTTYDASAVNKAKAHYGVGGYLRHGTDPADTDLATYAVWCADNATLYLTQSAKPLIQGCVFIPQGETYGRVATNLWTGNAVTNYSWNYTVRNVMTRTVIEAPFASLKPTSTRLWFNNCAQLQSITGIQYLNTEDVTNMAAMFQNCTSLQSIDISSLNMAKVTTMANMFQNCSALQTVNMQNLNPAVLTDMSYLFDGCTALTSLNLDGMITDNVTNMGYMFQNCSSLQSIDLSSFDTRKVNYMRNMFYGCSNLVEAYISSSWSTANVNTANSTDMFSGCLAIEGQEGATYDSSKTDKSVADDGEEGYMRSGTDTEIDLTPYVIYSETDNTLYFLQENKIRNAGRSFIPPGGSSKVKMTAVYTGNQITNYKTNYVSSPEWYRTYGNAIQHVVIDESFSTVKPLTLRNFLSLKNMESLTGLQYLNTSEATTMEYMFENCSKLTGTLDLSTFDTQKVTNMSDLFYGCSLIQTINMTGVVTPTTTNISYMFRDCSSLENIIGLNTFNTSNITTLTSLFNGCSSLESLDLSSFNVSNVTNISGMLYGCTALQSFSMRNWDISKLTSLERLYQDLTSLQTVDMGGVDLSSIRSLAFLFNGCTSLRELDVTGWNTSSVSNMSYMFSGCTALEDIIGLNSIRGSNVASCIYMFGNCSSLKNIDLSGFGRAYQMTDQDLKTMFNGCSALETLNLANFGTSSITDMASLFAGLSNLKTLNLTGWDTKKVTTMKSMFKGCEALETIIGIDGFKYTKVTDLTEMFYNCKSLEGVTLSTSILYNKSHLSYMFYGCESLRSFDFSNISTGSSDYRLSMESMFEGCSSLESVTDISFYGITSTKNMFKGCSNLSNLTYATNVSSYYVTDMSGMFEGCSSLTSLDLSEYNTERLEQFSNMFKDCSSLERIYIGPDCMNYTNNSISDESGNDVFLGCTSIIGNDGTRYDSSSVDWHKMHADTGGYLTGVAMPIAIFSENARTLYFLKTNSWINGSYHLTGNSEPIDVTAITIGDFALRYFGNNNPGEGITTVVFDSSFADYRPVSCSSWFDGCTNLTTIIDLENLNTSDLLYMDGMFRNCSSLTSLDLRSLDTSKVESMMNLFEGCVSLENLDISSFVTDSVTVMECMFKNCSSLGTLDVSHFNTSKVAVFNEMFSGCTSLQNLDLTGFDTSASDDMMGMFFNCSSLRSLDLSSFNTSLVYNMSYMFYNCDNLTELDLGNFSTRNVQSFTNMFRGMDNLTTLDISSFDICGDQMGYMFAYCPNLESIYIGRGWSCSGFSISTGMFTNCNSIVGQDGTTLGDYTDYHCAHSGTGGYMRNRYFTVTIPASGYSTFSCNRNLIIEYDDLSANICNSYSSDPSVIIVRDITEHWEPIHITLSNGVVVDIAVDDKIIPRNTGVVLKGTPGTTYQLPVYGEWNHSLTSENQLVAVTKATHIEPTEGEMTNFMLKNGEFIRIAASSPSSMMPANKAYLQVPTAMLPSGGDVALRIEWEDGTTIIEQTEIEDVSAGDNGIFDLNGRKLSDDIEMLNSLPEGIYIVNGKKIINKKR